MSALKEHDERAFYIRYMDDLLLVGANNDATCEIASIAITLAAQRNLEIPTYKRVHLNQDSIPFLGYLVDRDFIRPLSRNVRKIKRKLKKIEKTNIRASYKQMVKLSYDNWACLRRI